MIYNMIIPGELIIYRLLLWFCIDFVRTLLIIQQLCRTGLHLFVINFLIQLMYRTNGISGYLRKYRRYKKNFFKANLMLETNSWLLSFVTEMEGVFEILSHSAGPCNFFIFRNVKKQSFRYF